jgi:hypothetical protein
MHVALQGLLIGAGVAVVLIVFEYMAIGREVAERSKRLAKKVDWDSNQVSRMRGMITFGIALPIAGAVAGWWIFG